MALSPCLPDSSSWRLSYHAGVVSNNELEIAASSEPLVVHSGCSHECQPTFVGDAPLAQSPSLHYPLCLRIPDGLISLLLRLGIRRCCRFQSLFFDLQLGVGRKCPSACFLNTSALFVFVERGQEGQYAASSFRLPPPPSRTLARCVRQDPGGARPADDDVPLGSDKRVSVATTSNGSDEMGFSLCLTRNFRKVCQSCLKCQQASVTLAALR